MLHHLYDLAIAEQLTTDLDYEWHNHARFIIELGGEKPTLVDLSELKTLDNGKVVSFNPPMRIPSRIVRSSGTVANFMVDNSLYVLGWHPEKAVRDELVLFRASVVEVLEAMTDEGTKKALQAIVAFLDLPLNERKAIFGENPSDALLKAAGMENFAFRYLPVSPVCIHLYQDIEAFWKVKNNPELTGKTANCVVTGNSCVPIKNHKGVMVPGAGRPIPLFSFNKPAFESHGLSGNYNCPMSKEASQAISTCMSRLLAVSPVKSNPDNPNFLIALDRRSVKIGDSLTACSWVKSDNLETAAEPNLMMMGFDQPNPDELLTLLNTPYNGHQPALIDTNPFMTMVVQGAAGRPVFRSFTETTCKDVAANVIKYAKDLKFLTGREQKYYSAFMLVSALNGPNANVGLNASYAMDLTRAAFNGVPLPKSILQAAVNRIGAEGPKDKDPKKPTYFKRLALIKLYLTRSTNKEISMSLDMTTTNKAYLCGQLMEFYGYIQHMAMPNVSRTVVDSLYRSFRLNPAATQEKLSSKMIPYLRTIQRDKGYGTRIWLERIYGDILDRMGSDGFPTRMSAEDKGFFDIGFALQHKAFYTKGFYSKASEEEIIPEPVDTATEEAEETQEEISE